MKIVYLAHPISGNVQGNLKSIREYVRIINLQYPDIVPLVSYYADVVSLHDDVPEERARGFKNNFAVIERCDELWVLGSVVSSGMSMEIKHAESVGIPVIYK